MIITDEFSVYVNYRQLPSTSLINLHLHQKNFRHRWVNHSLHFVDPLDNLIHTNTIERLWEDLRQEIRDKRSLESIYHYLNQYMFFRFFPDRSDSYYN